MQKEGDQVHLEKTEARAARSTGHMRYVLGIGLFLAIAILSLVWISGALSQGDIESEATVTGKQEALGDSDEGYSMDAVTSDEFEEAPKATPNATTVN